MSGDWTRIIEYPIAVILLVLSVVVLIWFLRRSLKAASAEVD